MMDDRTDQWQILPFTSRNLKFSCHPTWPRRVVCGENWLDYSKRRKNVTYFSWFYLQCQYCYGNFLGYVNRTVDCMDDRNNTVPESYCSAVPAPPTRQTCQTRSCEAIWTKTSWSEVSMHKTCSTGVGRGALSPFLTEVPLRTLVISQIH